MFALQTLANLCSTRSGRLITRSISSLMLLSSFSFDLALLHQSIRTAKVFKPNLVIPKHRNIKVQDGQWVEKDTVLTLQNNLNLYPGENVRMNTCV